MDQYLLDLLATCPQLAYAASSLAVTPSPLVSSRYSALLWDAAVPINDAGSIKGAYRRFASTLEISLLVLLIAGIAHIGEGPAAFLPVASGLADAVLCVYRWLWLVVVWC